MNQSSEEYTIKCIIPLMNYIITTKEADSSFIADIAASAKIKILYSIDEF